MREICPDCQLILDRGEPDYFMGGYTVNFIVAELLIVVGGAVTMIFTWPQVPWELLTRVLILLMVLAPILFYPFAKNLWLSVDLIIRPPTLGDLAGLGEDAGSDPPAGEDPGDFDRERVRVPAP